MGEVFLCMLYVRLCKAILEPSLVEQREKIGERLFDAWKTGTARILYKTSSETSERECVLFAARGDLNRARNLSNT